MLRGIYTAASGMMNEMMSTDNMANNLANASTVGYKGTSVNYQAFPEMLMRQMDGFGSIGTLTTGDKVNSTSINFAQGQLQGTGNSLDLGMEGDGFFTLKNRLGQLLYTRDGEFTL